MELWGPIQMAENKWVTLDSFTPLNKWREKGPLQLVFRGPLPKQA